MSHRTADRDLTNQV